MSGVRECVSEMAEPRGFCEMTEDLTEDSLIAALSVIKDKADSQSLRLCIKPTGLVLSSDCIAHFGSAEKAYEAAKAVMEATGCFWDGKIRARLDAGNLTGMVGSVGQ